MSFAQKQLSKSNTTKSSTKTKCSFFNETFWKHLRLNKLRLFPSLAVKEIEKKHLKLKAFIV